MNVEFDAFVDALAGIAGKDVLVEITRREDTHVVAEIRGPLGRIVLGEDLNQEGRGVGWVPVGEQPVADRGNGFWIDRARCRGSEVTRKVIRGVFDDFIYIVTPS
jgi:hypothetical protein